MWFRLELGCIVVLLLPLLGIYNWYRKRSGFSVVHIIPSFLVAIGFCSGNSLRRRIEKLDWISSKISQYCVGGDRADVVTLASLMVPDLSGKFEYIFSHSGYSLLSVCHSTHMESLPDSDL